MKRNSSVKLRATLVLGIFTATAILTGSPANSATIGRAGDFNGDRYRDLAIGAYGASVGGVADAGAVGVIPGSSAGPNLTRYQRIDASRSWVPGNPGDYQIRTGLVSGDLNGDGYSDLAMCVGPYAPKSKEVLIAFGSSTGLTRSFLASASTANGCGSLASADFNRDGYADLVVRGERAYVANGGPGVTSPTGLSFRLVGPNTPVLSGQLPYYDPVLATGDVNGDGYADLVMQYLPQDGGPEQLGLFKGGPNGLPAVASQSLEVTFDFTSIAIGDINGDKRADIVAGRQSAVGGRESAGSVVVWRGATTGIDTSRSAQVITQNTAGIPGAAEARDYFGWSVALGDTNGDGLAELAIGSPGEGLGTVAEAGMVTIIPGASGGLNLAASKGISQNTDGIPGAAEKWDWFGQTLLIRDLDADGRMDLVVSSPRENSREGMIHVLPGSARGATGTGAKLFGPAAFGINRTEAYFGSSLG